MDDGPNIGIEGEDSIVGYWRFDEESDQRVNKRMNCRRENYWTHQNIRIQEH